MKARLSVVLSVVFLALWAGLAFAEQKGSIELTAVAEKEAVVTDAHGKAVKKLVPAGKVLPGDEIVYSVLYKHVGDKPAENVVIDNPIPEHMVYVDGSAEGRDAAITFSVDGGKTYRPAKGLTVKGPDGKPRPATAADYTGVRWTLKKPLKPRESGRVSFRARLK